MSWSGDVFNRLYNWVADKNSGVKIRADRMDAEFDNFKGGLEACLLRNGANTPSANLPFNGARITGMGNGVDEQDAATVLQVSQAAPGYNFLDNSGFEMYLNPVRPATTASAAGSYFADRWFGGRGNVSNATIAVYDNTDVRGYPFACRMLRTAGDTSLEPLYAGQNLGIENSRLFQYSMLASGGLGMVASIYLKKGANFSGTEAVLQIRRIKGAAGNPANTGTVVASATLPAVSINVAGAGDWVRLEVPYIDSSSNQDDSSYAVAVTYTPVGTAGAVDALYFTGVKLELNISGVAGVYSVPPLSEARARCARFYQLFGGSQYALRRTGYNSASAEDWTNYAFPAMDQVPAVGKTGTWTVGNCAQPSVFASRTTFSLYTTITALGTFGYYTDASDDTVVLDAEQ